MTDHTDQNSGDTSGSLVIERTFDVGADVLWAMWTEPEHFKGWYGPTGASIPVAEMDLTVGGRRLTQMAMETPNGPMEMWFVGEFREITPATRLVYTESMSDAVGNVQSPQAMGMPDGHPETTEVIVDFEDLGDSTRLALTHVGVAADSGGSMGWSMALDKLAEYAGSVT